MSSISSVTATQVAAYMGSMTNSLLQTGVTSSTSSALLGVSGASSSSSYSAADLFGQSSGSTAVSLAADTFSSVLASQGESMVRLSIQQATQRIKAQAAAKVASGQQRASAIKSVTA
jgi:hypothetical protein